MSGREVQCPKIQFSKSKCLFKDNLVARNVESAPNEPTRGLWASSQMTPHSPEEKNENKQEIDHECKHYML